MEITNNEGNQIVVSENAIAELRQAYNEGVWAVIVKDVSGNRHSVIIPDNFGHGK